MAENKIGTSSDSIKLELLPSEIIFSNENVFSDAYIFEYSCLSGSPLRKLMIEVRSPFDILFVHNLKGHSSCLRYFQMRRW